MTNHSYRTVSARLFGGLGNQLFIYATAKAFAEHHNRKLSLDIDLFKYDRTYRRSFLLGQLPNIDAIVAPESPIPPLTSFLRMVGRRFNKLLPLRFRNIIAEKRPAEFQEALFRTAFVRKQLILEGYWQTERYFRSYRSEICRALQPPRKLDLDGERDLSLIRRASWPVGVGLRLFREVPGHTYSLQEHREKYTAAIKEISRARPKATLFVFTEEPKVASDLIESSLPMHIITHRISNAEAFQNLYIMTHCSEYVIGVSSYHWWGAWLNENAGAEVSFLQTEKLPNRDYLPQAWRLFA